MYLQYFLKIYNQSYSCCISSTKKQLTQREAQTTWALFMVCSCFVIFVMPMEIYDILFYLGIHNGNSYIYLPLYFLYWLQYSLNFFIYEARSDQFRKAYLFFLLSVNNKYENYNYFTTY